MDLGKPEKIVEIPDPVEVPDEMPVESQPLKPVAP